MMLSFMDDTIVRLRPSRLPDSHGNSVQNWRGTISRVTVEGCSVQPSASQEDIQHREGVKISFTVFAPAFSDVVARDRVEYDGKVFEVVGEPEAWRLGRVSHVKILLSAWEG